MDWSTLRMPVRENILFCMGLPRSEGDDRRERRANLLMALIFGSRFLQCAFEPGNPGKADVLNANPLRRLYPQRQCPLLLPVLED